MPWIVPLGMIALGAVQKAADAKRAHDEHEYQKAQAKKQAVYNIKTAGLGGNQFQEMADRYKMGEEQSEHAFGLSERARLESPNNIGLALQGISAATSGGGDNKLSPDAFGGKVASERSGYDALKAAESAGNEGSIGSSKPFSWAGPDDEDDKFGRYV